MKMKPLLLALMIGSASVYAAVTPIYLPNLSGNATGTLSGGKNGLDVNINSGAVSLAPPAGGFSTAIKQDTGNASLSSIDGKLPALSGGTLPISAATLPLPTGAAVSAKQPALGTAGTASSDVITVQGISSMTALKVDGTATTQPISASSLPLPTGAAAEATLSAASAKLPASLGQKTAANSMAVTMASDQNDIGVKFAPGTVATFGSMTVSPRQNQIATTFNTGTLSTLTTLVAANGGTGTIASGQAQLVSGANTNGSITIQSTTSVTYVPGEEVYAEFTPSWSSSAANVVQRIGLYSATNGVYLGFSGLTFQTCVRSASSDTCTAQASFNKDTLTGTAGSLFTRNGTPEALDFTKTNVFRIRYGWLGSAPIQYEVLSPDGRWVTFHTVLQPNTSSLPSTQNPSQPLFAELIKTAAGASSFTMTVGCWAAGTTTFSNMPHKISDGTNTAAVKAASTAAAAADPALVVSISPNSTPKAPLNVNGSGTSSTVSTVITLTAPANAVGFVLMNNDTSTASIRWALGRTATTTDGSQLQPGRDTGFIPAGSNVTLVAESGTQSFDIEWVRQ